MNNFFRNNRITDFIRDRLAILFPLAYFMLGALSFNSLTAQRSYMIIGVAVLMLWALVTVPFSLEFTIRRNRTPFMLLALLFFVSYGISSAINAGYGVLENLKGMVWMGICLFLVFPAAEWEKSKGCRMMDRFIDLVILYTGVQAIGSIMTMIFIWNDYRDPDIYLGFFYGRLWGLYADPNYGGVLSAAAMLLSAMLLTSGRKFFKRRWPLYAHILLQYLYIVFCFSRTAEIALLVGTAFFVLYFVLRKGMKLWIRLAVSLLAILMCLSFNYIRYGYNIIATSYNGTEITDRATRDHNEPTTTTEWSYPTTMGELGRDEKAGTDLSEGRMKIWEAGVETFLREPVFGVSYRNILAYLTDNIPDSYMVTHNEPLNTFHNVFVDVLASQGAVGALIILAAFAYIAVKSIEIIRGTSGRERDEAITVGIPLLVLASGAMTLSDILYINSPSTVMFWYLLGHWMSFESAVISGKAINEKTD